MSLPAFPVLKPVPLAVTLTFSFAPFFADFFTLTLMVFVTDFPPAIADSLIGLTARASFFGSVVLIYTFFAVVSPLFFSFTFRVRVLPRLTLPGPVSFSEILAGVSARADPVSGTDWSMLPVR